MHNLGVVERRALVANVTDALDHLEEIHNAVLHGSSTYDVKGILLRASGKHDARLQLFYSDGCLDFVNPTDGKLQDCAAVSNGIMARGLGAGEF
jgi:hypothetical protein